MDVDVNRDGKKGYAQNGSGRMISDKEKKGERSMTKVLSRRSCLKRCAATLAAATVGGASLATHGEETPRCPTYRDTLGLLKQGKKIPIIFDSDIGGDIDDTWALLMALHCPELDVRLMATDAGNGTGRARLAAKFLEICGRTDVPVGVGIPPGDGPHNQRDWMGDYRLANYPGTIHEDGVGAIIRTIKDSPEPVTVVAIGGVPNIAAALERDPSIVNNARFVGMHGSIRMGYGGSSTPVPEANVRTNPKALAAVFAAPWECTVTPLDTCGLVKLDGGKYQKVFQHPSKEVRALIENYRVWIPRAKWVNPSTDYTKASTTLFDCVAVYLAYTEQLVQMEDLPIGVTDKGMTVIDESKRIVRCATKWKDLDAFEDHLVKRVCRHH
jgi:inosine-uridine nucleoside N-ribohydrolase